MHLQPGTLLQGGKYRIVRFIAAGGFGCTYEALHVALKKRVAIKEFFVSDFCNRDSIGRVSVATDSKRDLVSKLKRKFYDEACAVASLDHTGIVHVSDVFEENGTAYFVMDYIDGRSLAEIVKAEGPMSEARALGYIRQVCAALHYVHSQNRLHLDIKPNNIMVTGNDRAILIDFGVSKQYDEASGENTSTLLGCTPGYAPPEQMSQNIKHFYPATDVYSLGATLYDLLTGETPPDAAKRTSEEEELQPLSQAISAPTRAAVYAALELSKKKRPQSVAAFASMLDTSRIPAPAPAPAPKEKDETKIIDSIPDGQKKPRYKWYIVALWAIVAVILIELLTEFLYHKIVWFFVMAIVMVEIVNYLVSHNNHKSRNLSTISNIAYIIAFCAVLSILFGVWYNPELFDNPWWYWYYTIPFFACDIAVAATVVGRLYRNS